MRTITANCLPGTVKKTNLRPSFFFATLCYIVGLFFSTKSIAQSTPADCNSGCTSNDVQIIGAYLSDASGNSLTSFVCGSGVPVYLTLQLTTKTPRVGVSIWTDIQRVTNGVADGHSEGTVSQCFGTTLNTTGSIVTFPNPINWTCGDQIALVGTYTAWGTGNANFCTGSAFQCGGTPSKCHLAKAGEIIIIQVPQTGSASSSHCSDATGSFSSNFDLVALESQIISSSSNYNFLFYNISSVPSSSADTTGNRITNPSSFACTVASTTVYAYVCDKAHPTACNWAPVTLTIKPKPAATGMGNDGPICAGGTLHLSVDAVAGATYSWTGPNSFTSTSQNPSIANATTAGGGTYHLTITLNGCSSGDGTTAAVVNAQPLAPTIIISQQPNLCSNSSGSISVCSPNASYAYEISTNGGTNYTNAQTGSSISFTGLAAGSNPIVRVRNGTTGCAATANCSAAVATCPSTPNATSTIKQTEQVQQLAEPTVNAYPNPFNDKVKFVLNSPASGNGSLDIYNIMGQKIKSVYQGHINAGNQSFELTIPKKQQSTLIYVFRVGDKKITGKLLQLNN